MEILQGIREIKRGTYLRVTNVPSVSATTHSTGNVFADLGFGKETTENLRIRADLMIELSEIVQHKDLTQAQAAKLFGVSQPRVSDLVRGKIALFTIDMLVNMLARAGKKVVLQTKRKQAA